MESKSPKFPSLKELPSPPNEKIGWPWSVESEDILFQFDDDLPLPKISVVSPSYNQGQYLEETIRSVLLQGYPNFEYIIHDGGSTDNAIEILKKYDKWLTYWVSEPDRGQSHAINKGIQRATGELIFWLNSDDLVLPGAFFKVALAYVAHPEYKIISGQAKLIDQDSEVIGNLSSYFQDWDEIVTNPGNSLRQVSTFFSRDLFDNYEYLDENPNLAMDTDLLMRFTEHHQPLVLDDFIAGFRVHGEANTQHMLIRWYEENDRTRGKYLHTKTLRKKYNQRSSLHWISLSEMKKWTLKQRKHCLMNAIKMRPLVVFRRRLWLAVRKLH